MSNPVEECELEPHKACTQATKLLPALRPVQQCVGVPQVLILYPGTQMILYPVPPPRSFLSILAPMSATALSVFLLRKYLDNSWINLRTATASLAAAGIWSLHLNRDRDKMESVTQMLDTMTKLKDVMNKVILLIQSDF